MRGSLPQRREPEKRQARERPRQQLLESLVSALVAGFVTRAFLLLLALPSLLGRFGGASAGEPEMTETTP